MIHIYYGDGQGKTCAANGLILRALNNKFKVIIVRFFKTPYISGEDLIFKKFKNIKIFFSKYPHPFFLNNFKQKEKAKNEQLNLFLKVKNLINKNPKVNLIVLDEVLDLIKEKIISTSMLLHLLKQNKKVEFVLTGHYINKTLVKNADKITEMKMIKHYFYKGISARKGIEF